MRTRSPIISPGALSAELGRDDVRLVDVRWVLGTPGGGRAAYDAGHLPGAIFLDVDIDLAAPTGPGRHPLPTPAAFRDRLETSGIGSEDTVVAYDDSGGTIAARLWWMLDDLGHDRVAVLDGGIQGWLAAGLPMSIEAATPRPRGHLHLRDHWSNVIDRDELAAKLGSVVLLDARAGPRYLGETEPIDRVPGHIPTAINVPTADSLDPDGRILGATDVTARFAAAGADGSRGPVVTSCGSGVNACFNSLVMRLAGLPDPILYPGSYSDWTQAGMPIATGPEPGAFGDPEPGQPGNTSTR